MSYFSVKFIDTDNKITMEVSDGKTKFIVDNTNSKDFDMFTWGSIIINVLKRKFNKCVELEQSGE